MSTSVTSSPVFARGWRFGAPPTRSGGRSKPLSFWASRRIKVPGVSPRSMRPTLSTYSRCEPFCKGGVRRSVKALPKVVAIALAVPWLDDVDVAEASSLDDAEFVRLGLVEDGLHRGLELLGEAIKFPVRGRPQHDAVLKDGHAPPLVLGSILPASLFDRLDAGGREGQLLDLPRPLDEESRAGGTPSRCPRYRCPSSGPG
jgi:hypothetical protein